MIRLTASSIGPIAAEILAAHHEVEVLAVFERSFYLMTHGGLVCVGDATIGRGPINLLLAEAEAIDWRGLGIDTDTEGEAHGSELIIGSALRVPLAGAVEWQPPPWPRFVPGDTQRGLAALLTAAAGKLPQQGLAPLVLGPTDAAARSAEARAAAAQVALLAQRLPQQLDAGRPDATTLRALTLLLGLGPGLTPSGDDLIGGLLLALTALGHYRLRDVIWEALAPELGDLTTEISAMHLSAAADGLGAEAIHQLAIAVLTGDTAGLPRRLDALARIGHTSGWDTLAGFALAVTAALRGRNDKAAGGG